MNYRPPIAKGIIAVFDEFIEDLQKLAQISGKFYSQTDEAASPEYERAFQIFGKITEDSSEDDCSEMIKCLKVFPINAEHMTKCKEATSVIEFCNNCRRFRDLVNDKISLPLREWKQVKQDAMHFPEIYGRLQNELEDVRTSVEKTRFVRDSAMPEEEAKGKKMREMIAASEDFRSLHPFFIIANSQEHLEMISALRKKKVLELEDRQKQAEEIFQLSVVKYKKEIQSIIEETMKTKSFIAWLEEKDHFILKDYGVKIKEEWSNFSTEMEESRNLSKMYTVKHSLYLQLERERVDRERIYKQAAAVLILQKYWRESVKKIRLKSQMFYHKRN